MIKKINSSYFDTLLGTAELVVYKESKNNDNLYHYAIIFGKIEDKNNVFCRVHSACITSEIFMAINCDCREQFWEGLKLAKQQNGLVIYLQQEGRGNGIEAKIMQMKLENTSKIDTIDAFKKCGFPIDNRSYDTAADILNDLKIKSIQLLTANPDKIKQLEELGIKIAKRIHPNIKIEHKLALRNLKAKQKN